MRKPVTYRQWWLTIFLSLAIVLVFTNPLTVSAIAGLGGYIGEKLLGDGTNNILTTGDGTNTQQILGSSPAVTTLSATNNTATGGVGSAILHGNLTNLNGMPRADVWFEWGYSPLFLVNTTPVTIETTTGTKSVAISGLNTGLAVYYRIASSTDATTRGAIVSFTAGGGQGASYKFLRDVLLFVIAVGLCMYTLKRTENIALALIALIAGIVGFKIVEAFINNLLS